MESDNARYHLTHTLQRHIHRPTDTFISLNNVYTSYMGEFTINGHEVVDGDVKATGNGAHVYVPKRWRGADVKVVRTSDPDDE